MYYSAFNLFKTSLNKYGFCFQMRIFQKNR